MSLSLRTETCKPALFSDQGMVVAQNVRAARIGADILAAGGNAADAAVAVSFALGVAEPWMSGIGGGGAALFRDAASGIVHAVDFSLRAPLTSRPGSDHAVAVPGTVAGLAALHARFGRMPWAALIAPAVAEARCGLPLDWHSALVISTSAARLAGDRTMASHFLTDGWPPSADDLAASRRLPLEALADTLQAIADGGADAFYRGDVAAVLAREIAGLGGSVDRTDLATMSADVGISEPVRFRRAAVFLPPGPACGRGLGHALSRLEGEAGAGVSMRDWYGAVIRALDAVQTGCEAPHGVLHGADGASHFAVADAAGNLCSITQTLVSVFGCAVMTPDTGIILNDGMRRVAAEPGNPDTPEPGRGLPMAVCPVIVEDGARLVAIGVAGGRRALPAMLQVVGFLVDCGMTIEEAIHQPRVDCPSPETVAVPPVLADMLAGAFQARKTISLPQTVWPPAYSIVHALAVEPDGALGCADPISPGADAAAPDA